MSENERPALGSPEAAVRSIVNLISLATHTDEEKLAYWLDAYYQAREAFEIGRRPTIDDLMILGKRDDGPSRAPAPTEADKAEVPDNNVGNKAAEAEEPTPAILKSSRVLPSADQTAIQSKKRTRSQEAAAADKSQRAYNARGRPAAAGPGQGRYHRPDRGGRARQRAGRRGAGHRGRRVPPD